MLKLATKLATKQAATANEYCESLGGIHNMYIIQLLIVALHFETSQLRAWESSIKRAVN